MSDPTRLTYRRAGRTTVLELPVGADPFAVLARVGQEFERQNAEADARYKAIAKRERDARAEAAKAARGRG